MRKEVFLAICIGLSLGLLITYGVYTARQSLTSHLTSPQPSPATNIDSSASNSILVLTSPEDETVVTSDNVTIAGSTIARFLIIIFVNDEEEFTTADDNGYFSVNRQLEAGSNLIAVHGLDEDGKETIVERMVVYVTPEMEALLTDESAASASAQPASKPSASPTAKVTPKPTPKPTVKPN